MFLGHTLWSLVRPTLMILPRIIRQPFAHLAGLSSAGRGARAWLLFCLLCPGSAAGTEPLDTTSGLLQHVAPRPGSTHVARDLTFRIHLTREVDALVLSDPSYLSLLGNQSGPRGADELEIETEPLEHLAGFELRVQSTRPFLAGEEVSLTLLRDFPLVGGQKLAGIQVAYRVAPGTHATGKDLEAPVFELRQRLEAGLGPNMAVAADFDGDGFVDLAVSDVLGPDDGIHIFRSSGTGRLLWHESYPIDGLEDPGRFAVADVDADGLLDLVVVGQQSDNLAVLSGRAETVFEITQLVDLPHATPVHVAIGDLELDGKADILVAHLKSAALSCLRAVADGDDQDPKLELADDIAVLPGVQALILVDLDADLHADIAVVSEESNMVGILLADPTGGGRQRFTGAFAIPVGHRPEAIAAADLDADGQNDLVVTHQGSNDVAVLLGSGNGRFGPPDTYPVGDRPVIPALADLDGDGLLDLVVPNLFSDDVSVLMGREGGSFETRERLETDAGPVAIATADFDDDGDIDLAVVNSVADNVALYSNRQDDLGRGGRDTAGPRSLRQNIPNPFNPNTTISFTLLAPSHVNLVVFNTSGKIVKLLTDEQRPAGQHSVFWDATNELNERVPSGIYFYRLTTDETVELRRMTLLR